MFQWFINLYKRQEEEEYQANDPILDMELSRIIEIVEGLTKELSNLMAEYRHLEAERDSLRACLIDLVDVDPDDKEELAMLQERGQFYLDEEY